MQERRLGERPGATASPGPELREPLGAGGDHALGEDDAPDSLARHRRLEIGTAECLDHHERPGRHRVQVAAQRLEVKARGELVHLGVAHAGTDVAPRHLEALEPIPENLLPVGEKAVERDVFDARGVPEEPRDGVDARMRPRAELRVGEATEEAVHQPLVDLSVASQEEADGVHR